MRVRRILVTCLAGAVGATALPAGALAVPPATASVAMRAPAAPSYSNAVLAPSLQQLRAEVNARWPGRSRASDGWLGDAYHQRSRSEHNPVGHPNGPAFGTPGSVHALDITASGVDTSMIISALLRDARVWYVIHNRTIWSRTYGFQARTFYGDPHTTHIHVSLRQEDQPAAVAAERDTRPWLPSVSMTTASLTSNQVRALQSALIARGFAIPAGATGYYGPQTKSAVAAFQYGQGWRGSGADGIAGPETLRRLGVGAAVPTITYASLTAPAPRPPTPAPAAAASAGKYVPGASGSHISALQRALIARGIAVPSGATGFFGSETRAAVAAFQRAQGWRGSGADGVPGPSTLARLGLSGGAAPAAAPAPAPTAAPVVRTAAPAAAAGKYVPGASGSHISALQRALIARGIAVPSGATGFFGSETRAAVAAFQRAQGWRGSGADGVPGPSTLARLGLSGGAAPAAAPAPAPTAARAAATSGKYLPGASGDHIKTLQRALITRGIAIPSGPTGFFGSETLAAVAAFQRSQGWSGAGADGVPGSMTLARLGMS